MRLHHSSTLDRIKAGFSARQVSRGSIISDGQESTQKFVDTLAFENCVGVIILLNSALTGIEVEQRLSGSQPSSVSTLPFRELEIVFTMIYVIEFLLRMFAGGFMKVNIPINVKREWGKRDEYPYSFLMPAALVNEWVLFDGFLVSVAIMALAAETFQNVTGVTPTFLRLLRLLRLLRALRPFIQFRTLYILVRGLLNSLSVMLSPTMPLSLYHGRNAGQAVSR